MTEDIVRLIIAEAKAQSDIPLPEALKCLMVTLNTIIRYKIVDIDKAMIMEIPGGEKEKIIELILQAD